MKLLLFALGFAAACVFPSQSPGAERRPIYSAEFSVAGTEGKDRIDLYAERTEICGQYQRAVYVFRQNAPRGLGGTSVEGCYTIRDDIVHMIFVDGDQGRLPLRHFKERGI